MSYPQGSSDLLSTLDSGATIDQAAGRPNGPGALGRRWSAQPTELQLPDDLTIDEWREIGRRLRHVAEGVMWWLGDWWAYGKHHYGERKAAVEAETAGWKFQTCVNAGVVARSFESNRRRLLSWSHHAEVANRSDADELLDKSEADGWTRETLRAEVRRRRMAERLAIAAAEAPALVTLGLFQVVYADPPWQYEDAEPSRAVENNYLTMTLTEIADLNPPAAEHAVLFLWAPSPKLAEAVHWVIPCWGFEYRTSMVWVKDQIGMGYYARQQHEHLLIAKRGDLPVPTPDSRPASVVYAPRAEHSVKPERFYELIEQMYPGLAWVELFARKTRPGWTSWGNQL
jgi:N6-adenosine-specific RNA methylase IME4